MYSVTVLIRSPSVRNVFFRRWPIARYANEIGADAIAHGSTGAGNDQIRFDMTFLVLAPNVEIITLTRDMALSRDYEINYLKEHGFEADFTKLKYSYNVGLWGTSICGGEILDSTQGLPESAYLKQVTKTGSEELRLEFKNGEIHAVNGKVFEDKNRCHPKRWKKSVQHTVSAVTCMWEIRSSASKDV